MPFECPLCNKIFAERESLKQHEKAVHLFECPHCKKVFAKIKSLEQHQKAVHLKHITSFKCIKCRKEFKTSLSLQQHLKDKHYIKESKIEMIIPENSSLKEPIIVTKDYLPGEVSGFKCPDCGCEKALYDTSHAPLYSKRSYLIIKCSKCGKGFRENDF